MFYASNGFWASVACRITYALRNSVLPIIPRAISGFAHLQTGVDNPGTSIEPGLFIDHGTGIALGCTAVLSTPVVEIRSLHDNQRVKIVAKLQGSDSSGSVKNRIALSLTEQAEESEALTPGKIILESISGNTRIGLALVGAAKERGTMIPSGVCVITG